MFKRIRPHLSYANVGVTVALVLATSGFAVAAIPGAGGAITGCYKKQTGTVQKGTLRVIDASKKCRKGEKRIAWSQTGPPGNAGPKGNTGPQGSQGPATGPASGDLTGAYPGPVVAPGKIDGSKVADNSLTGDDITESTLANVPSAASAGSVGGENVVTATEGSNFIPDATKNIAATCPDDRLAVKGTIPFQGGVIVNSTTYGRSSFTVNATATSGSGGHFLEASVTCFGGT
jgi:hypothetical protein